MITYNIELGKPKKNGEMQLYIRITRNREIKRINFPVAVTSHDLDKSGNIKNRLLEYAVNDKIQSFRKRELEGSAFLDALTLTEVADYLQGKKEVKKEEFKLDFIAYGRDYIRELRIDGRDKTAASYRSALNSFAEYLGKESVDINDITKQMLLGYQDWFKSQDRGERAWELYMTVLKALHTKAKNQFNDEDDGVVNVRMSPFNKIEFKRSASKRREVEKRSLTVDSLRTLWSVRTEGDTQADVAKKAFFLSFCLCGMNAADMYEHTQGENPDRNVIEYYRKKTRRRSGAESFIRITVPEVVRPFHESLRGKDHTWMFWSKYSTPDALTRGLNDGLRKLVALAEKQTGKTAKQLGLEGVTFYAARHTWSTIAANDCGISTETIDKCLCHVVQSLAATTYIKKDYRFADDANGKVMAFVFGA